MKSCEQGCGRFAATYALDPKPGGWGGFYCEPCRNRLHYKIVDRLAGITDCRVCGGGVPIEDAHYLHEPTCCRMDCGCDNPVHAECCTDCEVC